MSTSRRVNVSIFMNAHYQTYVLSSTNLSSDDFLLLVLLSTSIIYSMKQSILLKLRNVMLNEHNYKNRKAAILFLLHF